MATTFADIWSRVARSPGFKFFLVCLLVLLVAIPLLIVWAVVSDRSQRASSVQREIAAVWGGPQDVLGPYLVVPYTILIETTTGDQTSSRSEERRAVFLPEMLNVSGDATSEIRRRSIYDVTVYTTDLNISGRFESPDIRKVDPDAREVRWNDAIILLGVSDVSGLKPSSGLRIAGVPRPLEPSLGLPGDGAGVQPRFPADSVYFDPGIGIVNQYLSGIHARLYDTGTRVSEPLGAFDFDLALSFAGSSTLTFSPVARETSISLRSNWPHPSFIGSFLPDEREITAEGFSARWQIPHLARSVPQEWTLAPQQFNLDRFAGAKLGVNFFIPVDYYNLVDRAAKYGIMFVAVAFGAVFLLEMLAGKRVHAVQYIFVGLAMVFFYVLLLSVAEHWGFLGAYVLSAVATGVLISTYVAMAMGSAAKGIIMMLVFLFLYGLLYLILQLEDYALLAGAIAGFLLLAAAMFATLRIDWSGDDTGLGLKTPTEA
jgi:inner membrane protein